MKKNPIINTLALALGGLLFASCATQQEYQEAVDLAAHYQDELLDKEAENARLLRDNKQLRGELTLSQVRALEASGPGSEFETRLAEYEQLLAELGSNPGGIQRFDLGGGAYVYMVPDNVLFASGSADLSADGRQALVNTVAADIQSAAHGRIWVRGHTDSDPVVRPATLQKFPHGNLQLSSARAIEVAAVLIGPGNVPSDQVVVSGFGPYEPLAPNDSAENKALNRRVEIYVSPAP